MDTHKGDNFDSISKFLTRHPRQVPIKTLPYKCKNLFLSVLDILNKNLQIKNRHKWIILMFLKFRNLNFLFSYTTINSHFKFKIGNPVIIEDCTFSAFLWHIEKVRDNLVLL